MKSHREIINKWGSPLVLAADIGMGEKPNPVYKWRKSGRIPPHRWLAVSEAARKRGWPDITVELLDFLDSQASADQ